VTIGAKTLQVFEFVASYAESRGHAPSYREIAAACGLKSTSNVAYHLDKLVAAGCLARDAGKPRSIGVVHGK
jgi:repressor LexA